VLFPPPLAADGANFLSQDDDDQMLDVMGIGRIVSAGCTGEPSVGLEHARRGSFARRRRFGAAPHARAEIKEAIFWGRIYDPAYPAATYANGRCPLSQKRCFIRCCLTLYSPPTPARIGMKQAEETWRGLVLLTILQLFANAWRSYDASAGNVRGTSRPSR